MHLVIFTLLATLILGGCSKRLEVASVPIEPDTEWIMDQYKDQDPVAVNARRCREGW